MLEKNRLITASLVLYNTNSKDLDNVIKSVLNSPIDRLYIIDNSPSNQLADVIDLYNSNCIEYYHGQGNIGFGRGNNIGIRKAILLGAQYHIVLNPDIIFEHNVITELERYMSAHHDVGMILPRVVYPNGRLQFLCKLLPTPLDIFGRRVFPRKWIEKKNYKYEMHFFGYDKIWNCPILSGCFMFLRVSSLKDVGVFDDRFFMYFEDFDLMRRIHEKYKTIFYPFVSIIHNHAAEHRTNYKLLLESIKSAIKYFNKWGWFYDPQRRYINNNALKSNIID